MPSGKYRDLNYCVQVYKASEGVKKDLVFLNICEHLVHHVHSLLNILCGRDYPVNMKVFKMIKAGLRASFKTVREDYFLQTVQQLAISFQEEDVRQQILLTVIELINSYTHDKLKFLAFVTYLLPRRIASWLCKNSKDVAAQFGLLYLTEGDSGEEGVNYQDYFIEYPRSEFLIGMECAMNCVSSADQEFIHDYLDNLDIVHMMQKYHILTAIGVHTKAEIISIQILNN